MFGWLRKKAKSNGTSNEKLPEPQDDYDHRILGDIKRVGWSVIQIAPDGPDDDGPQCSFSVGIFHTHKHAEIILLGLPPAVAGPIINNIGAMVMLGQKIEVGRPYDDFTSVPVMFVEVDPAHYKEYKVDPILWTKTKRFFATPGQVFLTGNFCSFLLASHPSDITPLPVETEVGSAGEHPAKG